MAWLVDTDLLSERTKKSRDPRILDWLHDHAAEIYTSSHVIAELQAAIAALPPGEKRRRLERWFDRLLDAMEGRILNFNVTVAVTWGRQEADYKEKGCTMPMPDSFIAATARRHNLTIATKNVTDYQRPGLKVFNPLA